VEFYRRFSEVISDSDWFVPVNVGALPLAGVINDGEFWDFVKLRDF
jgi:hypothetical protein